MNFNSKYLILLLTFWCGNLLAFESFVVKKISIQGLKGVSKDVVLRELKLNIGDQIDQTKAQNIIKSLYNTSFFEKVELEKHDNTLIVKLLERAFISKIEIIGIKNKEPISKILKELKICEGFIYDPNIISQAEQNIYDYYLSNGHYGIHIETSVVKLSRNRRSINFNITEGEEAKIAEININGNINFHRSILLKQLLHKKTDWLSWFTKNDRYLKEKLNEDLETLKSFYMNHGYIDFQVDSTQVSLSKDQKKVYININISEGERYNFGEVHLDGVLIVPRSKIESVIQEKIIPGQVYSLQSVLDVKKSIETTLAELGYIKAHVEFDQQPLANSRVVNIELKVLPHRLMTVRKLMITGNGLTEDFVIRRMLPQLEGANVSSEQIQEGKTQILRYGYADKVELIFHPIPGVEDQVDLEYKIEEKRNMKLSAGINYSGGEGLGYEINADIKNFIGTGKDLGFGFNRSRVSTLYKLNYFDPYYTIDGIGFGYNLFYHRNHFSKNAKITDYLTNTLGGDLSWSFPISNYTSILCSLGYSNTHLFIPQESPTEILNFTNKKGFKYKEYNIGLELRYNSLDRYLFPTSGLNSNLSFKHNLSFSALKYYQINYLANFYKPLSKGFIVNLSSNLGYGNSYGRDLYPFFKNYFVGGPDTLRGFEEKSLGPKDSQNNPIGGNLLINFRSSLILPVPFKPELENIVRPGLFLDAGQVLNTTNNGIKTTDHRLRLAAGFSVAVYTPMGFPVVLSLAKPLNLKPGDVKETFSFTFSAFYN